jgi:hypothetical protein
MVIFVFDTHHANNILTDSPEHGDSLSQTHSPLVAVTQHSRFLAFSSLFVRVKVNHKWSRKAFRARSNRFEMSWRLLVVSCRARRSR